MDEWVKTFTLLWAVIDPIGTIPVFLAVTRSCDPKASRKIALHACGFATLVLLFFILVGQAWLDAMDVPLQAFQISGGIVLFLFALSMIFGESKPEEELRMVAKAGMEKAVFPLAIPSIAGPGAIVAVVLLTDSHRFSVEHQLLTTGLMLVVVLVTLLLLLAASHIQRLIGESGASMISRIMGLMIGSVAADSVLSGLRAYFQLSP